MRKDSWIGESLASSRVGRQADGRDGPLAERAVQRWLAAVRDDERTRDREAQAPSAISRPLTARAVEALEDAREISSWQGSLIPRLAQRRRSRRSSGAEGIRTPCLRNANAALYQLSYSPVVPKVVSILPTATARRTAARRGQGSFSTTGASPHSRSRR